MPSDPHIDIVDDEDGRKMIVVEDYSGRVAAIPMLDRFELVVTGSGDIQLTLHISSYKDRIRFVGPPKKEEPRKERVIRSASPSESVE